MPAVPVFSNTFWREFSDLDLTSGCLRTLFADRRKPTFLFHTRFAALSEAINGITIQTFKNPMTLAVKLLCFSDVPLLSFTLSPAAAIIKFFFVEEKMQVSLP